MTSEPVISSELVNLRRLFRQWRAEHPRRHFPKEFWIQVAQCARCTDPKMIAAVLGFSLAHLRSKICQYQELLQEPHQEDAFILDSPVFN